MRERVRADHPALACPALDALLPEGSVDAYEPMLFDAPERVPA